MIVYPIWNAKLFSERNGMKEYRVTYRYLCDEISVYRPLNMWRYLENAKS